MKKTLTILLSVVLCIGCLFTFAACGDPGVSNEIIILVPSADHGWTGAVQTYAVEKAAEITAAGNYKAIVKAAASANDQVQQIDDILAATKKPAGIIILPHDNTLEASMVKIASNSIPFVMFDRIIENAAVQAKVVSNVKGDNEGIGAATAKRFVDKGMLPGDAVYEMIGDTSSVPASRSKGFRDYLTGVTEVGGAKIANDKKWTTAQLDKIVKSAATDWSRDKSKTMFSTWLTGKTAETMPKWIFTHDDEVGMAILEELKTNTNASVFTNNVKALGSSSGLNEMYAVLKDKHQSITRPTAYDLFSVTYDPAMIKDAIQTIVDKLDGKTVVKDNVISVKVVDKDNVADFQGFGTYAERS